MPLVSEDRFLFSMEQECMTVVDGTDDPGAIMVGLNSFLSQIRELAPAVAGNSGVFTGYGRLYEDCGHLEYALAECDSPASLVRMQEQMQLLCRSAMEAVRREGTPLRLMANNHGGLLHPTSPTWGTHENYLVEQHPPDFAHLIIPFLATRIYAGSGGLRFPTGQFVASVRSEYLQLSTGGGTTRQRAIHSTCREEHLTPRGNGFRYHLLGMDGHRSQFNLGLTMGATALVLKALVRDRELPRALAALPGIPIRGCWMRTLQRFNRLARACEAPRVDPRVIDVQRVYLESARRTVDAMNDPPAWTARTLEDWQDTLDALARMDRIWLATRLDAFTKYELYAAHFAQHGLIGSTLRGNEAAFSELALLDHSYHEFGSSGSSFDQAVDAGLVDHRLVERITPGREPEPWVPDVATRAKPRARFIAEHSEQRGMFMDWSVVVDRETMRRRHLKRPFDAAFEEWTVIPPETGPPF
jgi:hypothetical protein